MDSNFKIVLLVTQVHTYMVGMSPAVKLISYAPHKPLSLLAILHNHAFQVNMLGQKNDWSK